MSVDKDGEYQPKPHCRKRLNTTLADRPKRTTRKVLDYKEEPVLVESDEDPEKTEDATEGVVERVPVARLGTTSLWSGPSDSVWSDSASDRTVTSESWSPATVERRIGILFDGVQEVKSQLQQLRMAKKEEMGVGELIKIMMEMNNKQEEQRQKRDEERERIGRIENTEWLRNRGLGWREWQRMPK